MTEQESESDRPESVEGSDGLIETYPDSVTEGADPPDHRADLREQKPDEFFHYETGGRLGANSDRDSDE